MVFPRSKSIQNAHNQKIEPTWLVSPCSYSSPPGTSTKPEKLDKITGVTWRSRIYRQTILLEKPSILCLKLWHFEISPLITNDPPWFFSIQPQCSPQHSQSSQTLNFRTSLPMLKYQLQKPFFSLSICFLMVS